MSSKVIVENDKDENIVLPEELDFDPTRVEGYDANLEYTEEEEARVRHLIDVSSNIESHFLYTQCLI